MIRSILEFWLSRVWDENPAGSPAKGASSVGPSVTGPSSGRRRETPLFRWLQRRVQRDAQLRQFEVETRKLDALLRSSADECRQTLATRRGSSSREAMNPDGIDVLKGLSIGIRADAVNANGTDTRHTLPPARRDAGAVKRVEKSGVSVRWLMGLAAAAVLLIVVLPSRWPYGLGGSSPTVHAGDFSQQLTIVPGEVLRLITQAAETSQTQLPQLSPLAQITLPTLPAWEDVALRAGAPKIRDPLLREIDTWQESWKSFKIRLPESLQEI